jgi:hypothetical protein
MIALVAQRLFTAAEANAALETIRPLAEELVSRSAELRKAAEERQELLQAAAGNGGGATAGRLGALAETIQREQAALARCAGQIEAEGVQIKDFGSGLLDFPAERDGEEILLCWRVGEPEVAWWHTLDGGFAGRQPLDAE